MFSVQLLYHKDSNMFRPLNKVKPCSEGLVRDQIRISRVVITFFLFFPPFLFQGDLLTTAELPSLCKVVSSIYQIFVPHFAMAVFIRIYSITVSINSATRSNSSQFSRLLIFQNFNHGLNHSKIHTARQFCDFQCLLFLFRQSSMVKPV